MLELKNMLIEQLIPCANNARTHDNAQIKQIASSIKEFSFNNPVLIDEKNGIIAGHGRVLAAKLLNLSEVPTITLPHLSETQKKAYILADNRMALDAGWDVELLKLELTELDELDFDLSLTGFGDDDLSKLYDLTKDVHLETEIKSEDVSSIIVEFHPDLSIDIMSLIKEAVSNFNVNVRFNNE
jgi:ParB-like chromosome segregation protein Spo0J